MTYLEALGEMGESLIYVAPGLSVIVTSIATLIWVLMLLGLSEGDRINWPTRILLTTAGPVSLIFGAIPLILIVSENTN